jgi:glutaredoxin
MIRGLILLLLIASSTTFAGQVFRWVDEQGGVHYTDQPPPPSAKQSIQVKGKGNVVETDKEPYETRLAREKNPVVLYITACGATCDKARAHLERRGIPFTQKDPAKSFDAATELKQLTGVTEVPVIRVGKTHQKIGRASCRERVS